MGTWSTGPFDNDTAADWAGDLHDARPDDRAQMVRAALMVEDGYLDMVDGQIAIAAVAVVAAVSSGMVPDSAYWPDFLTGGETLPLPDDLRDLALAVLDRVTGDESDLQAAWTEGGPDDAWAAEITTLRTQLGG